MPRFSWKNSYSSVSFYISKVNLGLHLFSALMFSYIYSFILFGYSLWVNIFKKIKKERKPFLNALRFIKTKYEGEKKNRSDEVWSFIDFLVRGMKFPKLDMMEMIEIKSASFRMIKSVLFFLKFIFLERRFSDLEVWPVK